MEGRRISEVIVRNPSLRWPVPAAVARADGQRVVACRRRAKYMLIELERGGLLIHLGMSGSLRIWSAMLRCNVGLLETITQSRNASGSQVFRQVLDDLEESVESGEHIGAALARSKHIDPIIASAVMTGEQNGRLSDAVEFVTDWLEEDNRQMLTNLTRIAEPALLAVMGLGVGCVSATLFMPLFDMATM